MIKSCPICGTDFGVTHGDQLWTREVCEDCQADPELMTWWEEKQRATRTAKTS